MEDGTYKELCDLESQICLSAGKLRPTGHEFDTPVLKCDKYHNKQVVNIVVKKIYLFMKRCRNGLLIEVCCSRISENFLKG